MKKVEADLKKAEADLNKVEEALQKANQDHSQAKEQTRKSYEDAFQKLKDKVEEAVVKAKSDAVSEFKSSQDYISQIRAAFKMGEAQYKEKIRAVGVLKTLKKHLGVPEDTIDEKLRLRRKVKNRSSQGLGEAELSQRVSRPT